jgi:hypothetical protein
VYVRQVRIRNLRSFRSVDVDLNVPPIPAGKAANTAPYPNVTLLVGDNGAGKTSVLRATALAALAPIMTSGSGYVPFSLVRQVRGRRAEDEALVEADLDLHEQDGVARDGVTSSLRIKPTQGFVDRFLPFEDYSWSEPMWSDHSPAFLVVGYGASRAVDSNTRSSEASRSKTRLLRYGRVAGLFEEGVVLTPLAAWLPELQKSSKTRFNQVIQLINRLLAPHGELLDELIDGEPLFRVGGSDLPFQALSDGYRAYVGWISDLLYHLNTGAPHTKRLVDSRGVVLVDEVDLHLHPAWQMHVMPTLSRALPNLQFVFSSHSPLVVGSLHASNVVVLESVEVDGVSETSVRRSTEEVYGLSADQILTSGHFGLRTTRVASFEAALHEVASAARDGDPDSALRLMRLVSLGGAALDAPTRPRKARKAASSEG